MKSKRNNIKIFLRILPTADAYPSNVRIIDNKVIEIEREELQNVKLETEWIFHNASQEAVYNKISDLNMIKDLFSGISTSLFTYGINSSGKTFSLFGRRNNFEQRGLIHRALSDIYKEIAAMPRTSVVVKLSALDLAGDSTYDLLRPSLNESKERVCGRDISEHVAVCEEDAICLLLLAIMNKKKLEHKRKSQDWGHVIFKINVTVKSLVFSDDKSSVGDLKFIELSGAVGTLITPVTKDQLVARESVSTLEHNMISQRCPTDKHNLRCRLSYLLNDEVCGKTNVIFLLCVRLEKNYMRSTTQTLMFALRIMRVTVKPQVSIQATNGLKKTKLAEEVRALKLELYRRDLVCNRKPLNYLRTNENQRDKIYSQVQDYMEQKTSTLEIPTLFDVQTAFESMRIIYNNAQKQHELQTQLEQLELEVVEETSSESDRSSPKSVTGSLVGKGFAIGMALPDQIATSSLIIDEIIQPVEKISKISEDTIQTSEESKEISNDTILQESAAQRVLAFEDFKRRAGKRWNDSFVQHKATTEKKKIKFNEILASLREVKKELRSTKEWYHDLSLRATDLSVVEEIGEIMEKVDGLTEQHDFLTEESIRALGEVRASQKIGHRQRQQFMQDFDSWYEKKLAVLRYQQMLSNKEYHEKESEIEERKNLKTICQTESFITRDEEIYKSANEKVDNWIKHSKLRTIPTSKVITKSMAQPTFDFLNVPKTS